MDQGIWRADRRNVRAVVCGAALAMSAIVIGGCETDGADTPSALALTMPLASDAVTATIGHVPTFSPAPFVSVGCSTHAASPFDLTIRSSASIVLNSVTFRLIDGSLVGGRSVTFPSAQLSAQFGTTRLFPHAARTFRFAPQFGCGAYAPYAVAADITYFNHLGTAGAITVSGPRR